MIDRSETNDPMTGSFVLRRWEKALAKRAVIFYTIHIYYL